MTLQLARRVASGVIAVVLAASPAISVAAPQTVAPAVTAESEDWFLAGGPVTFNGNVYYPSGPIIHFVANEMVRTGVLGNTPIFVRSTQEPGSLIYVPLAGGVMRPYERRRSGELAGTTGSTVPSYRVVLPSEQSVDPISGSLREPAPPLLPVPLAQAAAAAPQAVGGATPAPVPEPVGTTGVVRAGVAPARTRIETVRRPAGLNTVFVDFQNARWVAEGPAVEFAAARFSKIGERHGFPVYAEPGREDVIYLPLLDDASGLLAPYRKR